MQMNFNNNNFFASLSSFKHQELFLKEPIWSALERLNSYLTSCSLGEILGKVSDKAYIIHPEKIFIGENTVVEPGAYIEGPCVIGSSCVIRSGAYVRSHVLTGDRCVIGHGTEIKHSILLDHVHAAHFSYVGDSILGERVNLGAGCVLSNLRLDERPIKIRIGEKKVETNLIKLGSILGDSVQIGCNSVLNPGTLIESNSICYPCLTFGGFFSQNSTIKTSNILASHKKKALI